MFALAALLAAATALSRFRFPLLGLLLFGPLVVRNSGGGTPGGDGSIAISLSARFRNGLGKFSSSEKSCSGSGDDGCCGCGGTMVDRLGTAAKDEGRLAFVGGVGADNPVGSEVEAGSPGR